MKRITAAMMMTTMMALLISAPAAHAVDINVSVNDNYFKPKKISAVVGDVVIWKWDGYAAHNVVVTSGPQKFKSKIQSTGTFKRTIRKPGKYKIVCTLHKGMEMVLKAK